MALSCTGVVVPGLEYLMIDELGLNRNVIRLGINFMGCFGGLAGKFSSLKRDVLVGPKKIKKICVVLIIDIKIESFFSVK